MVQDLLNRAIKVWRIEFIVFAELAEFLVLIETQLNVLADEVDVELSGVDVLAELICVF